MARRWARAAVPALVMLGLGLTVGLNSLPPEALAERDELPERHQAVVNRETGDLSAVLREHGRDRLTVDYYFYVRLAAFLDGRTLILDDESTLRSYELIGLARAPSHRVASYDAELTDRQAAGLDELAVERGPLGDDSQQEDEGEEWVFAGGVDQAGDTGAQAAVRLMRHGDTVYFVDDAAVERLDPS